LVFSTPPTLDLDDVRRALGKNGFASVRDDHPHEFWEGATDGKRRIVQIDRNDAPYGPRSQALAAIIRTSGIARRLFYWAANKPLPWTAL
jgi:hypothetical protein